MGFQSNHFDTWSVWCNADVLRLYSLWYSRMLHLLELWLAIRNEIVPVEDVLKLFVKNEASIDTLKHDYLLGEFQFPIWNQAHSALFYKHQPNCGNSTQELQIH